MFQLLLLILLVCPLCALSQDPADSWLSYAAYNANGAKITAVNASWIVPDLPTNPSGSNAPGWWYGIQTGRGDGALIQPILAYGYQGDFYSMFNGVFDWTDGSWHTSDEVYTVKPGDKIVSSITYDAGSNSYTMYITSTQLGQTIATTYVLQSGQTEVESVLYFVLEHQPDTCDAYPPDGICTFTDILVYVQDNLVNSPQFVAAQKNPACNSQATIVDSQTIKLTWSSNANPAPKKWGYGKH